MKSTKHEKVSEFANQWTITPADIKKNCGGEFYDEGSKGINIDVTLVFKPQQIFLLGLVVSASIFAISVVCFLILTFRKKRRQIREVVIFNNRKNI